MVFPPLCFPLLTVFRVQLLVEFLHPVCTVLPHFLGYMAVRIQGELGGCVAKIGLNSFDIVSCIFRKLEEKQQILNASEQELLEARSEVASLFQRIQEARLSLEQLDQKRGAFEYGIVQ